MLWMVYRIERLVNLTDKNMYSTILLLALTLLAGCSVPCTAGKVPLKPAVMPPVIFNSPTRNKTRLRMPVLMNFGGPYGAGSIHVEAMRIALQVIEQKQILPNYELEFELFETYCTKYLAPKLLATSISLSMQKQRNETEMLPIILGPVCSDSETVGFMFQHFNYVAFTGLVGAPVISEESDGLYDQFHVMIPSVVSYFKALPAFLKANGWQKVHYLSDSDKRTRIFDRILIDGCKKLNISLDPSFKMVVGPDDISGPSAAAIEEAVINLKKNEPRIIVSSSFSATQVSCILYKHGLYGPGFVLLHVAVIAFSSDTPVRFAIPGCTEEQLFKVLQSTIFYGNAAWSNIYPETTDSIGFTAKAFDQKMIEAIEDPQKSFLWWYYRACFYDLVTSTALLLNKTIEAVSNESKTIEQWKNDNVFMNTFKENVKTSHFQGLFGQINDETPWSSVDGPTAFYQVQRVDGKFGNHDFPMVEQLTKAAVAIYYPGKGMVWGPNSMKWVTTDGKPPRDRILTETITTPQISESTATILLSISGILLLATFACFFKVTKTRHLNPNRQPALQLSVLCGVFFILLYIVLVSLEPWIILQSNSICMYSLISLCWGTALVFVTIAAKLGIAKCTAKFAHDRNWQGTQSRMKVSKKKASAIQSKKVSAASSTADSSARQMPNTSNANMNGASESFTLLLIFLSSLLITGVVIAWFIYEPLSTTRTVGSIRWHPTDVSRRFETVTEKCAIGENGINFVTAISVLIGMIALYSIFQAISLRGADLQCGVADLALVKMASYAVTVATIAGAVVVTAFFIDQLLLSICVVAILNISLIFAILFLNPSALKM